METGVIQLRFGKQSWLTNDTDPGAAQQITTVPGVAMQIPVRLHRSVSGLSRITPRPTTAGARNPDSQMCRLYVFDKATWLRDIDPNVPSARSYNSSGDCTGHWESYTNVYCPPITPRPTTGSRKFDIYVEVKTYNEVTTAHRSGEIFKSCLRRVQLEQREFKSSNEDS
eukprot:sb/3472322/